MNKENEEVSINVLEKSADGEYQPLDHYYTSADSSNTSLRGYEPVETDFAVFVRDRWDNYSDTLFTTLAPWFEEQLVKPYDFLFLPGDRAGAFGWKLSNISDDNPGSGFHPQKGHYCLL